YMNHSALSTTNEPLLAEISDGGMVNKDQFSIARKFSASEILKLHIIEDIMNLKFNILIDVCPDKFFNIFTYLIEVPIYSHVVTWKHMLSIM
ncbi:hypothetical protein ACJX0J_009670, partial [Zea mays]